jgi:hypothetical protein
MERTGSLPRNQTGELDLVRKKLEDDAADQLSGK